MEQGDAEGNSDEHITNSDKLKVFPIWSLVTGSIQDGHNICAYDGK